MSLPGALQIPDEIGEHAICWLGVTSTVTVADDGDAAATVNPFYFPAMLTRFQWWWQHMVLWITPIIGDRVRNCNATSEVVNLVVKGNAFFGEAGKMRMDNYAVKRKKDIEGTFALLEEYESGKGTKRGAKRGLVACNIAAGGKEPEQYNKETDVGDGQSCLFLCLDKLSELFINCHILLYISLLHA